MEFRNGDVRVRELITYQNFKKFEVATSIKYGPPAGDEESDADSEEVEEGEEDEVSEAKEDAEDTDSGEEEN